MKIHLISDTHFNHEAIKRFGPRPDNFNELIIRNWNKRVNDEDLVIHLGDVIFSQASTLDQILGRLKGRKVLSRGNHDGKPNIWYMQKGFDFVCDWFTWKDVIFSHKPVTPLPEGVNINIHGHFHNSGHHDVEYNANEYFQANREKYKLVQIEEELRPFLLEELLK